METHLIMLRDAFDASRVAGVNVRELAESGMPTAEMDIGFATYFNICPGWEPGTEWNPDVSVQDEPGYPLMLMMLSTCPPEYRLTHSVFGKWHFYTRNKV